MIKRRKSNAHQRASSNAASFISRKESAKIDRTKLQELLLRYMDDVYAFIRDIGVELTWQQLELVAAYNNGDTNIAIKAGKGPGKTFVTTLIASHWLLTHPYSSLIVTAPTFRQCKDVWLAQMEKTIINAKLPVFKRIFKFYGKGVSLFNFKPNIWGCQLITAREKSAFQGIHNRFLFMLEEEAGGIRREISEAAGETLSNAECTYRHFRIGNPNTRDGAFYDSFYRDESDKWTKLTWNAEETPESEFFSKRRNRELEEEFGKDSDIYRVAVLGEFPRKDSSCLIDETMLKFCMTDEAEEKALNYSIETGDFVKQIGIDLGRSCDRNAIVVRQGNTVLRRWSAVCEPIQALDKACAFQDELGWEDDEVTYVLDTSGMGEGMAYIMGSVKQRGKKVHEFYTQNTAAESRKYKNKMTEGWCSLNKKIKKGEIFFGKLDNKTIVQLTSRQFKITTDGKMQIESKQEYKDRLKKELKSSENGSMGRSPDEADALIMAFYPYATQSLRVAVA